MSSGTMYRAERRARDNAGGTCRERTAFDNASDRVVCHNSHLIARARRPSQPPRRSAGRCSGPTPEGLACSIDATAIAATALIVSWCRRLGSQAHDGPVLANRTTSSAQTGRSRKAGLAIRQARHARRTASRFHRLEIIDEAGNHVETLVPERWIPGIKAEGRKKFLVVP